MSTTNKITRKEAKPYLISRSIFLTAFILSILSIAILSQPFVAIPEIFSTFLFTLLFLAISAIAIGHTISQQWKCPRCKRRFSVKLGLMSISWPYLNSCLHCEATIETTGHP
jgi:hypothetical protein